MDDENSIKFPHPLANSNELPTIGISNWIPPVNPPLSTEIWAPAWATDLSAPFGVPREVEKQCRRMEAERNIQ
jgi:hypothetical protein